MRPPPAPAAHPDTGDWDEEDLATLTAAQVRDRLAALASSIDAAVAARIPQGMIEELRGQGRLLEQRLKDCRPIGARIDSAQARLSRADRACAKAREKLEEATEQLEDAETEHMEAQL